MPQYSWNAKVDQASEEATISRHFRARVAKLPRAPQIETGTLSKTLGSFSPAFSRGGVVSPQKSPTGLAKYDLDGDGRIDDGELAVARNKYGWESDVKVWVMGEIGTKLLRKLEEQEALSKSIECPFEAARRQAAQEFCVKVDRRRLHCQSPGWLNCGGLCTCEYYNAQLFLPMTCFSSLEMAMDLQAAARQLLDQCGLRLRGQDGKVVKSSDFIIVVEKLEKEDKRQATPAWEQNSQDLEQYLHSAQTDYRGHVPWEDFERLLRETRSSGMNSGRRTTKDSRRSSPPRSSPPSRMQMSSTATSTGQWSADGNMQSGGSKSSFDNIFANMGVEGGHFVCYRLRQAKTSLRASYAEQDESGVISHEVAGQKPISIAEYEANELLLPHLLNFCEEYRAVKVGQLTEEARAKAELQFKEPWRAKKDKKESSLVARSRGAQPMAATTSSWNPSPARTTATSWNPSRAATAQASVNRLGDSLELPFETAQTYEDVIEKPRLLCRCGHGELWHRQPRKPDPDDAKTGTEKATKANRRFPAPPRVISHGALPVDDVGKTGTATIQMMRARRDRLAFSKIGGSTLPQSASDSSLFDV